MMLHIVILTLAGVLVRGDTEACGSSRPRDLSGLQGEFQSPGFPTAYPNSANCQWRITADTSDTTVRVEFDDFATESGYDYVRFYDGSSTSSPQLRTQVSGGRPNATESSGNVMLVAFTSDSSVTDTGFKGKFTTEKACSRSGPRQISASSPGSVTSPYFPNEYGGGMRCNWTITADSDKVLSLSFDQFDIEDSETEDCRWDYVDVYDGDSLVGRYCGGYGPPAEIRTFTNQAKIFFRTDLAIEQGGFRVNYSPVDGDGNPVTGTTTPSGGSTTSGSSGSTTPGSGGSTTPEGTTQPPVTGTPPPTLPPPEGLFLEMAVYADVTPADGGDISLGCTAVYQAGLSISLAQVIFDINDQLGDTLCEGVTDLYVEGGNSIVNNYGQAARVGVAAFLSASATRTFQEHHDCSREVVAYLGDHTNWPSPVIPTIEGCALLEFEEAQFSPYGNGWSC